MTVDIGLKRPTRFYQLEEAASAIRHACRVGLTVYTWKTSSRSNWLERTISNVDALGLVLLPSSQPSVIDLPNDAPG